MIKKGLFILLLFSFSSYAQVPGYMGKRLMIGYGVDVLPALSATALGPDGGVNLSHNASLEFAIRPRTNFCLSYRFFRTGSYNFGAVEYPYNTGPPYYSYSTISYTYDPKEKGQPMQVRSSGIGMAFKFFHPGMFAPVGKYRKLGCTLMFTKLEYENDRFLYYDPATNKSKYRTFGNGEFSDVNFVITYEIGRQRVIADRFILDGGLRLGVMPGRVLNVFTDALFDPEESDNAYSGENFQSVDERIQKNLRNRLFTHELFSVHIGLGFLAF